MRFKWDKGDLLKEMNVFLTSLLPLPNPLMTGPDNLMGNGGSGPAFGPATGSRGPSGRISILAAVFSGRQLDVVESFRKLDGRVQELLCMNRGR